MKIHKFQNYEEYIRAQSEANRKKLNKVWAQEQEIKMLSLYIQTHLPKLRFGICHGVRNGFEVSAFRKYLNIEVIGTEISNTARLFAHVIQWDFHDVREEWLGNVDFIYSNALDHSYDPKYCLDQWMRCLRNGGFCIVQWSPAHEHNLSSDQTSPVDCFGASREELQNLILLKYAVKDRLELEIPAPAQSMEKSFGPGDGTVWFIVTHQN